MKDKIFIDTSIFVQENFTEGNKIRQLLRLGQLEIIDLWITEIVYNEVLKKIKESLISSSTSFSKFRKDCKILRLSSTYTQFFVTQEIDTEKEFAIIVEKFDTFLNDGRVRVLKYSEINIKYVFESYFEIKSPFGNGKKDEFPDAFSLALIEKWCKENLTSCFTLSLDNDYKNYISSKVIFIKNFAEFIDKKNIEYLKVEKQNLITQKIKTLVQNNIERIIDEVSTELVTHYEVLYKTDLGGVMRLSDIVDLSVTEINFINYLLIDFKEETASIEVLFDTEVVSEVNVEDYSSAFYDKEESKWHMIDHKTLKETFTSNISAKYIVELNPPAGAEFAFLKFEGLIL